MISTGKALRPFLLAAAFILTSVGAANADVAELDNNLLSKAIADGIPVIDVRRLDEWKKTGVIDGAHLLTFFDKRGRYDAKKWLARLDEIAPKGSPVVLICAAGVRSKTIADLLDKRLGYTGVHNSTKGMQHWIKEGMPVVSHADAIK